MTHPWHLEVREDWLDLVQEPPIEPALSIVDPHHHMWDRPDRSYRAADFAREIAESGHNVLATVYMDAGSGYLPDGPAELKPVGETRWVVEESATLPDGAPRVGLGIVGRTDFRLGDGVREVLEAHVAAGDGRFRGIRQLAVWDDDEMLTPPELVRSQHLAPGLFADEAFRRGFRHLGELRLTFDAWVYSPQLPEVVDLADAFPETTIVLNHCGTPLAEGAYATHHDETLASWKSALTELGKRTNVCCKLGGLAKWLTGSRLHLGALPPSSEEAARAWGPAFERCLEAFGPSRCMFESNFPQEKPSCSYGVLWNACKRWSAGLEPHERRELFTGAACRAYRLDLGDLDRTASLPSRSTSATRARGMP